MDLKTNRKTGLLNGINTKIKPSTEDKIDAYALKFWRDNRPCLHCGKEVPDSYKAIKKLWDTQTKILMLNGIAGINSEEKRKLSDLKWAILNGLMEAQKVIDEMINYVDTNIEEELLEENNPGGEEDGANAVTI